MMFMQGRVTARRVLKLLAAALFSHATANAFIVPNGNSRHPSFAPSCRKWGALETHRGQKEVDLLPPLLLTFDLDDTLFPVGPVVEDSNQAMIGTMKRFGYRDVTQQDFLSITKSIRSKLAIAGKNNAITYSDLRKRAIAQHLQESFTKATTSGSPQGAVDNSVVDHIFGSWVQERHDAAERHLFEEAIQMLQQVQDVCRREGDRSVCIAAITNGRGNPLHMPNTLSKYFDFCVSGEDADVFPNRKPHPEIYKVALHRFQQLHESDEFLWVHVGDCLANDVGASADCGAYAVWVDNSDDVESSSSRFSASGQQPKWSTATESEREQRALLTKAAEKKVYAQISSLSELVLIVQSVLTMQPNMKNAKDAEPASMIG